MSSLFDGLLHASPWLVLALVFLLPAAEASVFIGVVFPGEIAVLLGGVLANQGRVSLWAVIALGFAGAGIGDTIGYEVGRRYGRRILNKLPRRLVKPEHLDRGEQLLRDKGGRAVFIGRFTATLRALVPGLAGMSRLPYRRFLLFNLAGAASWVTVTAVTGYVVGQSYHSAEHRFGLISIGLLAIIAGWLLYRIARRSARLHAFIDAHVPILHRLDPQLARVLVALVGATWLFVGLAQDASSHDGIALSDRRWLNEIIAHRADWITPIAKMVTAVGTGPMLYTALALSGLFFWYRTRAWRLPVLAVVTLAVGQLARDVINHGLAVPRPPTSLWLVRVSGYAFPSGHTTSSTIGYGLITLLLIRVDPPRRWLYGACGGLVVIAVGLSRLYLGVHWPSDVLGGWAFGVAWLALAILIYRLTTLRHHTMHRPKEGPSHRLPTTHPSSRPGTSNRPD
jgi:membrane protein DedA with SNARE-associated domain